MKVNPRPETESMNRESRSQTTSTKGRHRHLNTAHAVLGGGFSIVINGNPSNQTYTKHGLSMMITLF